MIMIVVDTTAVESVSILDNTLDASTFVIGYGLVWIALLFPTWWHIIRTDNNAESLPI